MDPNNPSGGPMEEEEDDDDDLAGEESEAAASSDREAHRDVRPPGPERTAEARDTSATAPPSTHDRGAFSFFSWLRRDQPAEEEPPPGDRKPDQ